MDNSDDYHKIDYLCIFHIDEKNFNFYIVQEQKDLFFTFSTVHFMSMTSDIKVMIIRVMIILLWVKQRMKAPSLL